MEENKDVENKNQDVNVDLIYYLDDQEAKKGNLKLKKNEIISYIDITESFCSFLEENQKNENDSSNERYFDKGKNNIIYESIRYFDGDGWIKLNENEVISIDEELTLNNLKIMIYCDILSTKEMNIKKNYEKIDKQINNIKSQMSQYKNYDSTFDAPLNLVVLTANPLMDGEKELRIINEFNIITSKIYKSFEEKDDYLKYTKFLPLTLNTLKYFITNEQKRPVILHLICKSIYNIQEKEKDNIQPENSEDYTNLIFEDDNNYYNLNFVNKKILEDKIFNYNSHPELKENVKKIILIISTPLSKDVYNIFKNFGFKNIIIQHTTLADVNFIADFNYTFYEDIVYLFQPINNIYQNALNYELDCENPPIFCCCFHEHKITCDFVKNLKNELYNNKNVEKLEKFEELAPHLYHLYPDCYQNGSTCEYIYGELNSKKIKSFCNHTFDCFYNFKYLVKFDRKKWGKNYFINFCCCQEKLDIHNINSVFITDFSEEKNNNDIRFRKSETAREKYKYTPNYEKMISFIGNNEVIFKILNFFSSKDLTLNIYGDDMKNLKKFGDVIIEYYLERYYFYEYNESSSDLILTKNKSTQNFDIILNENNNNDIIDNIELHSIKSTPLVRNINKINFVQINIYDDHIDGFKEEDIINNNTIFFIYVHSTNLKDEIKIKIRFNKIIWFTEEEDKNIQKSIKFIKEPILKNNLKTKDYLDYLNRDEANPNEYIKYQNDKIVRNYWRRKHK